MPAAAIIPHYDGFVRDLNKMALFGRHIYGRDVAKVCLEWLACQYTKSPGRYSEGLSIDRAVLMSAIGRLFSRLDSYFAIHCIPVSNHRTLYATPEG
jgi:hypothetical protein